MEDGVEIVALFVPIVSVIVIGLVVIAFFFFRHKNRIALQETIQRALAKGGELSPELIERLAGPRPGPHADLRKALIWMAVGLGFVFLGVFIPDDDSTAVIGVGSFPLLIGVAYLIIWKFTAGSDRGD